MQYDPSEPRTIAQERVYGRMRSESGDGRHSMLAVALAVFVFVGTGALGFWHATQPPRTLDQFERGIAELTDVDTYIASTMAELEETAASTDQPAMELPGYPLRVVVTPAEVLDSTPEELRDLVLERSAALLYVQGISAFDRTGNQSLGFLTSEWFLDRVVTVLTGPWHDRARWVAILATIGAGLSAALIFARRRTAAGLQSVGLAVAAGAIPGVVFAAAGAYWFGRTGDDPFSSAVGAILESFFLVPRRDYLVITTLGAFFAVVGYLLPLVERFVVSRAPDLQEPAFEPPARRAPAASRESRDPGRPLPDHEGNAPASPDDTAAEVNS